MGKLVCRLKLREKVAYILEIHDLGNYMKVPMTQPQHMTPVLTHTEQRPIPTPQYDKNAPLARQVFSNRSRSFIAVGTLGHVTHTCMYIVHSLAYVPEEQNPPEPPNCSCLMQ